MINITCNNKEVRTGTCADVGDSNVVAYISFFDTTNNTERKLYQPVYGDFKTSTAYLFDLSGNSITLTYADSNKTRTELEDLLVDCCGCVGGDGTVTSFSAGNLSPLFTTNVATPTTTPALSFNLSNCNQYQVFGRVVAGTGAPSYVTLNSIAFNGLSLPNNQIAYGTGSGISSSSYLTYTGDAINHGDGLGTKSIRISSGGAVNEGGYILFKRGGSNTFLFGDDAAGFGGSSNDALAFVYGNNKYHIATNGVRRLTVGGNGYVTINNIPTASVSSDLLTTNGGVIETRTISSLGYLTASTAAATYVPYVGATNNVDLGANDLYLGNNTGIRNIRISSGGAVNEGGYILFKRGGSNTFLFGDDAAGFGGSSNDALAFVYGNNKYHIATNGVRRLTVGGNGYVTINNIPSSPSSTDILVSNSGVVSTRTVASLGIPVITPAALTKTDDTNVTMTLGGTPSTALLQNVSLTLGWNGVLSTARGGTGLGSLGAANQLLRVNTGGTALEYFTPNWTTNTGTVTSVAASISGTAIVITGSPITTYGTLDFTWMGSIYQYVRGDGTLAYLPASANYLTDLLDVTITSPGTGQLLRYNGTEWVNWTPNFLTGNQTITLSGDVTGSGATSITTTIAANAVTTSKIANTAVTFAKIQNINTNRLLGRSSAGSGSVEEISIGSGLSLSGGTLSASGGGGNNVWLVQSSGIQATTNLEDIYHVGKVKVGSSGTSSFMLSVSGTTYSSQGMYINNNYPYYGYNTSAVPIIIGKIDSSNMVSLGENNYNIILPAYTSSRSADSLATTDGYLYVTNAGVLNKHEVDLARNEGASVHITSTESHAADSTYRRVTFDTGSWSLYGGYTADYTTGDNKIILPSSVRYHFVIATIEYTTSGTPTVTVDIRKNSTAIETNISTSDDERKVMTVHTLMYNASSSQYPTIYIKVSGAAITLQKCNLTAIPCGMAGS
jgi:hypothetical protein